MQFLPIAVGNACDRGRRYSHRLCHCRNDTMARHDDGQRIAPIGIADGTQGGGMACTTGFLRIADGLSVGNGEHRLHALFWNKVPDIDNGSRNSCRSWAKYSCNWRHVSLSKRASTSFVILVGTDSRSQLHWHKRPDSAPKSRCPQGVSKRVVLVAKCLFILQK